MDREMIARTAVWLREQGAAATAVLPVERLVFRTVYRDICAQNACGMYGRCWMCPPDAGGAGTLIARARGFDTALVYQTIGSLEDSFDVEEMLAAGARHNELALRLQRRLLAEGEKDFLHLGAGGCRVCDRCTRLDELPCRSSELAIGSLEAYCVDVAQMAADCGMRYNNGENTVTYFGALLLRQGLSID